VRYRILAAAFVLTAAVGPLALAAAALRAASPGFAGATNGSAVLPLLAGPLLAFAAAVAAVLLVELAFDVVKLRRVKSCAEPLGTVAVRGARIGTSRTVATPTAIGYLHPAVVLPEGFRTRVDEREWNAVVAHECAHLARHDDWAKALQTAALRLGWFLPGLWLLGRALDLERELASDERAACETGPRRYAACLLRLATDRCGDGLAPAFGGRRSHVAIRVERLLRPVADRGPAVRAAALGAFTAVAFAVVGAAALCVPGTRSPVTAAVTPPRAPATVAAVRRIVPRLAERARRLPTVHRGTKLAAAPQLALAGPQTRAVPSSAARAAADPALAAPALARTATAHAPAAPALVARAAPHPAAADAPAPAARRAQVHRAPAIRPADAVETLAFVAPRRRCRTCFGPLRSPDDAVAIDPPSFVPAAGLPGGSAAAVAASDPTSGPVDLSSQTVWFRNPARAISGP
jgi:hypothetical protein